MIRKRITILLLFLTATVPVLAQSAADPRVKHVVVPAYPRLAWFAQLEGTVNVDVEIGADGHVLSAAATGAHNLLDQAADENARNWLFVPSDSAGASARKLRIKYVYKLEGKKQHELSAPEITLDLPDAVTIVARPPEPEP
jgi:TonB family protein